MRVTPQAALEIHLHAGLAFWGAFLGGPSTGAGTTGLAVSGGPFKALCELHSEITGNAIPRCAFLDEGMKTPTSVWCSRWRWSVSPWVPVTGQQAPCCCRLGFCPTRAPSGTRELLADSKKGCEHVHKGGTCHSRVFTAVSLTGLDVRRQCGCPTGGCAGISWVISQCGQCTQFSNDHFEDYALKKRV